MKPKFNSLFDVLAHMLHTLNTSDAALLNDLGRHTDQLSSAAVRYEVDSYLGALRDNQLGIERIFSYLMKEESKSANPIIREMIHELYTQFSHTDQAYLKDVFMITSLRGIVSYKMSLYYAAYQVALELELETPADILHQLFEKEVNASKSLDRLSLTQFTNVQ